MPGAKAEVIGKQQKSHFMEISEATESTVAMLVSSERQVTSELPRYQQRSSACPDGYVIAASCSVIPGAIGPKTRWAAAHPYRWLNVSVRKFASNHEEPYHGLSSETSSKMHSFFVAASGDCARLKRLMGGKVGPGGTETQCNSLPISMPAALG